MIFIPVWEQKWPLSYRWPLKVGLVYNMHFPVNIQKLIHFPRLGIIDIHSRITMVIIEHWDTLFLCNYAIWDLNNLTVYNIHSDFYHCHVEHERVTWGIPEIAATDVCRCILSHTNSSTHIFIRWNSGTRDFWTGRNC